MSIRIKQLLLSIPCCLVALTVFTQVTPASIPSTWTKERIKKTKKDYEERIPSTPIYTDKGTNSQKVSTIARFSTDSKGTVWINEDKSFVIDPSALVEEKVPPVFFYYFLSEDETCISDLMERKVLPHEKENGFTLEIYMADTCVKQKIDDEQRMKSELNLENLKKKMIPIKGGAIQKGRQRTRVIDEFEISPYEVTVAQFALFLAETPNYIPSADSLGYSRIRDFSTGSLMPDKRDVVNWKCDPTGKEYSKSEYNDYPVVHVSWLDAMAFCRWLNQKDPAHKYRLPTIEEWNLAARSGHSNYQYPWGNKEKYFYIYANIADKTLQDALFKVGVQEEDGYLLCSPVGTYKPNDYGLYDMIGNVAEWCQDIDIDTKYSKGKKIYKGGSYASSLENSKIDKITAYPPYLTHPGIGFRVCRVSRLGY